MTPTENVETASQVDVDLGVTGRVVKLTAKVWTPMVDSRGHQTAEIILDTTEAEALLKQIQAAILAASQGPSEAAPDGGGEYTTELGCRVLVVPPELRGEAGYPERSALVFRMIDPLDGRHAEVLLADDERAKLKAIL